MTFLCGSEKLRGSSMEMEILKRRSLFRVHNGGSFRFSLVFFLVKQFQSRESEFGCQRSDDQRENSLRARENRM